MYPHTHPTKETDSCPHQQAYQKTGLYARIRIYLYTHTHTLGNTITPLRTPKHAYNAGERDKETEGASAIEKAREEKKDTR